jgi:hypothetical protein
MRAARASHDDLEPLQQQEHLAEAQRHRPGQPAGDAYEVFKHGVKELHPPGHGREDHPE